MKNKLFGILGMTILIVSLFYFANSTKVNENSELRNITLWVHNKTVLKPNIAETQDENVLRTINNILDNLEWTDNLEFDIHERNEDYEFWTGLKTGELNSDYYVWFNNNKNIIFDTITGKYAIISNEAAYILKSTLNKVIKEDAEHTAIIQAWPL